MQRSPRNRKAPLVYSPSSGESRRMREDNTQTLAAENPDLCADDRRVAANNAPTDAQETFSEHSNSNPTSPVDALPRILIPIATPLRSLASISSASASYPSISTNFGNLQNSGALTRFPANIPPAPAQNISTNKPAPTPVFPAPGENSHPDAPFNSNPANQTYTNTFPYTQSTPLVRSDPSKSRSTQFSTLHPMKPFPDHRSPSYTQPIDRTAEMLSNIMTQLQALSDQQNYQANVFDRRYDSLSQQIHRKEEFCPPTSTPPDISTVTATLPPAPFTFGQSAPKQTTKSSPISSRPPKESTKTHRHCHPFRLDGGHQPKPNLPPPRQTNGQCASPSFLHTTHPVHSVSLHLP